MSLQKAKVAKIAKRFQLRASHDNVRDPDRSDRIAIPMPIGQLVPVASQDVFAGIDTVLEVGIEVPGIKCGFSITHIHRNFWPFGLNDEDRERKLPNREIRKISTRLSCFLI